MHINKSVGVIGLGVMGANLAKNIASKNFKVSVFNRSNQKTEEFIATSNSSNLKGFEHIQDFINSLELPRQVILMVKSGDAVDELIEHILPLLDTDDILIDCGNSNWHDTERRQKYLQNITNLNYNAKSVYFVGCGVSGGEEGALHGPSIMPGGKTEAVNQILPILEEISAKDFNQKACVANIGLGASGHFVKMVHNGIEYALMQGIAEIYDILKYEKYSNSEISNFFKKVNSGLIESFFENTTPTKLEGFLLDISVDILKTKDKLSEGFLVDKISDEAGAKGTGKWTVEAAMDLGVYAPTIAAAVFARIASARNQSFKIKSDIKENMPYPEKYALEQMLSLSLESVYISSFLQGIDIISKANLEYNWNVNIDEVLRIWQGGCIIRTELLLDLAEKLKTELNVKNNISALDFVSAWNRYLPLPVIHSSLDYFQSLCVEKLPTNLIQAQRDFFGAHTYKRIDRDGIFTGGWKQI